MHVHLILVRFRLFTFFSCCYCSMFLCQPGLIFPTGFMCAFMSLLRWKICVYRQAWNYVCCVCSYTQRGRSRTDNQCSLLLSTHNLNQPHSTSTNTWFLSLSLSPSVCVCPLRYGIIYILMHEVEFSVNYDDLVLLFVAQCEVMPQTR